jgi:hypothetical protein
LEHRSHNHCSPRTGIFVLAEEHVRKLPTVTDNITHETIHPSVLRQKNLIPINPALLCELLPLEKELQKNWPFFKRGIVVPSSRTKTQIPNAGDEQVRRATLYSFLFVLEPGVTSCPV